MNSFIRSLMEERNIKQKELAEILGISSAAISQWAEDGTNINIDSLFYMSKLFHVTVDEIVAGKRIGESLEDKWKREFDINEDSARKALIDGIKDKALRYISALSRANVRFFDLFIKKIKGDISKIEQREWDYLREFYTAKAPYDWDIKRDVSGDSDKNEDDNIVDIIKKNYDGYSDEELIWELQKIYRITTYGLGFDENGRIVVIDDYCYDLVEEPLEYVEDDDDIYFALYKALPPIKKDKFLTSLYNDNKFDDYLYEFIKCGGNILYTAKDFNVTNYDFKDLDGLEGDIVPVKELDEAQAVIFEVYNRYDNLSYTQYQALINHNRMKQIEMAVKYKKKAPVKYWEYIKNNDILI